MGSETISKGDEHCRVNSLGIRVLEKESAKSLSTLQSPAIKWVLKVRMALSAAFRR